MAVVYKIEISESEAELKELPRQKNWFGKRKNTTIVLIKDKKGKNGDRSGGNARKK